MVQFLYHRLCENNRAMPDFVLDRVFFDVVHCTTLCHRHNFFVCQLEYIVTQRKGAKMGSKKLNVRLSDEYFDMIDKIILQEDDTSVKESRNKMGQSDIVKVALREYYTKRMGDSADEAYMTMVTSTLNNLIAPYFNTLIAAVQKLTNSNTKVDESVKLETLMNRMCFNLLFRSDELPEDEELLYKVLIKRTPFDDVLERVAKEKDTYNSVPDEADGSK